VVTDASRHTPFLGSKSDILYNALFTTSEQSPPSLSLRDISDTYTKLRELSTIYYCAADYIPLKDNEGKDVYWTLDDGSYQKPITLLHSSLEQVFLEAVRDAGFVAVSIKERFPPRDLSFFQLNFIAEQLGFTPAHSK